MPQQAGNKCKSPTKCQITGLSPGHAAHSSLPPPRRGSPEPLQRDTAGWEVKFSTQLCTVRPRHSLGIKPARAEPQAKSPLKPPAEGKHTCSFLPLQEDTFQRKIPSLCCSGARSLLPTRPGKAAGKWKSQPRMEALRSGWQQPGTAQARQGVSSPVCPAPQGYLLL